MKRLFYLYTLLILAGCTEVSVNDIYEGTNEKFQAFIEDNSSRTYIDGQIRMRWTAEDCVTLFRKNTYNREYMFTGKTGANSGGFRQVSTDDDFWFGYDVKANYAIYPHSADTELDETELYITYNIPSEQTYVENSFGLGANVMVAVADDAQLMFKNVGSYLRVRLYGESVSVSSITLTSKGGEAIAGKAKITPTMGGNPTCEMIGNGQSIRLVCPAPVTISSDAENPTDFWIVVPPVTFSKGFSVTVENSDGDTQVFDVDKSVTFKRNSYNNLSREVAIESIPTYHVATAGTLSSLISEEEKYTIAEMKVTGYLDGDDIRLLRDMAGRNENIATEGRLETLDISECHIIESEKTYLGSYTTTSNTLCRAMFCNCDKLKRVKLPQTITRIEGSSLGYCENLIEIDFPTTITYIGDRAFSGTSIESVIIPNGVVEMGNDVFMDCEKLHSVSLPNTITRMGWQIFYGCKNLKIVNIPTGISRIPDTMFYGTGIEEIVIPDNVVTICSYAFNRCEHLSSVSISDNANAIGTRVFENCWKLASIVIPSQITEIPGYAFFNCKSLKSIIMLGNITEIESHAFLYCGALEEIHIKAKVPPILKDYVFIGSIPSDDVVNRPDFSYDKCKLYIPKGSLSAYQSANYWKNFTNIIEE